MNNSLEAAAAALRGKKRVLAATHVNPDGDAVGSAVALAQVVMALGCDCRLFLGDGLPEFLSFLPLPCPWARSLDELDGWVPDLVAATDCGDASRLGPLEDFFLSRRAPAPGWETAATLNIDHHPDNALFADHNWADARCSATGLMIGLLAEYLKIPLAGNLGWAVYLSLVSDTGNFTFSNTDAESFAMAGRIVQNGLKIAEFSKEYENTWTLERMRLWGRLLSEITLHKSGDVACSIVPRRYLRELNLKRSSLDGYASWLRKIRGVRVAVFIREDERGLCKLSLRSMGVDVQKVAACFGGGGHRNAAGAEVSMSPGALAEAALAALDSVL
ncbi:MAG: bifunctional oligoribonuclease/PAP phosphatase NrnA [Deltaproteobacteria bacterium]|jgi:phosphoesterase RecJ-like protein|nr:bifunctional oligoribonuclease/PAP phosphatase NrnA [Deltaproteobacteria bacterium]